MKPTKEARAPEYFSSQVSTARRFYLNLKPSAGAALTVVSGGWERSAEGYRIARRSFPYFGVEYVVGGSGRLSMQGRSYALRRGCVFAYGPGVAHEITSEPEDRLVKYFADFSGRRSLALLAECGLPPGAVREVGRPEAVERAFEELVRAGVSTGTRAARLAALQLEVLLVTLSESGVTAESADRRAQATYLRCRRLMEERFLSLASVAEVAEACHVDGAYLCRLFARYDAQSPYRFLQRLRMNHAAALLEGRDCLIREASDALGMDAFHFSRVFKRVHGLSPRAFLGRRAEEGRAREKD